MDAASRSWSRSAVNTGCSMCQSAGCFLIPSANTSASCWVIAAAFCLRSPSAGTSISGYRYTPQPSSVYHRMAGTSAAPVCTASAAGPGIIRAFSPKKPTSMPLPVTSLSAGRQTTLPARSRWASTPNRLFPPLAGSTSMPSPSRNATNRSYTDSGLSRSITVVNDPAPRAMIHAPAWSQLPMCGSAKITPRPAFM